MKRTLFALACAVWLLGGCGGGEHKSEATMERRATNEEAKKEEAPSAPHESEKKEGAKLPTNQDNPTPPFATNSNLKQTKRDFIRTGDVQFQVKNVYKTTVELENLVASYKGFITENSLNNSISKTEEIEVNRDSILRVTLHRVENHLTIRLPKDTLDTFLQHIGKWSLFLDRRVVRAEDVTLTLKGHTLADKRNQQFEQRYTNAIDGKNQDTKLGDHTQAEDNLLQRQNMADQNRLQAEGIRDRVEYCTLQLHIYQAETVHKMLIENYRKVEQYRPSFWSKIGDAFLAGWHGFLDFLIALTHIWMLLVIAGIVLGVYFYQKRAQS